MLYQEILFIQTYYLQPQISAAASLNISLLIWMLEIITLAFPRTYIKRTYIYIFFNLKMLYINFFKNPQLINCCAVLCSVMPLCNPIDCCPPGSSIHGIFQATILEQIVLSYSKGYFQPMDQSHVSCIWLRVSQ